MSLIFLAILGALVGLVANRVILREQGQNINTINVLMGALGAAIGGWLMLPAMGAVALLGAMLGAGLMLSIINLLRRRGIP